MVKKKTPFWVALRDIYPDEGRKNGDLIVMMPGCQQCHKEEFN